MSMSFLRSQKNKLFTTVIFGLIILTFIFWGVAHDEGPSSTVLTTVNGEDIPYNDYQRILSRQLEMYGQILGGGKKLNENLVQLVERQVVSSLIMRKVLAQKAESLGIVVGKEDILAVLEKNPAFQDPVKKRFSPTAYRAVLESNNLNPNSFEVSIREDLAGERLRDLVENSVEISDREVLDLYRSQQQKAVLEAAVFDPAALAKKAPALSSATISEHFNTHKSEYLRPEQRTALVASMKIAEVGEKIAVEEIEIEEYFQKNIADSKDEKWSAPRAHALHILISDTKETGLKKIKDIQQQIQKNPSEKAFREAAQKTSEDYSNASQGGDLGYFDEKAMVKPFAEAVFKTAKINSVHGPVKTDFGYHLIWVADRSGKNRDLSNRKGEIIYLLKREKSKQRLESLKSKLQSAFADPTVDAQSLLTQEGFTFRETKPFDAKTRVPELPFVLLQKAAKAPAGAWQGPEEADQSLYAYQIKNVIPPQPMTLEEARPLVIKQMENEALEKTVQALPERLKKNEITWEQLASKEGAKITTHKDVKLFEITQVPGFDESDNLLKAVQALTALRPLSSPLLHEGKWILFRASQFSNVPAQIPPAESKKIKEELLTKRRKQLMDKYTEELVKAAKIPESTKKKYNI